MVGAGVGVGLTGRAGTGGSTASGQGSQSAPAPVAESGISGSALAAALLTCISAAEVPSRMSISIASSSKKA
jgi:hypothetical protein